MQKLTRQDLNNIKSKNFDFAVNICNSENFIQYEETEFWLEAPKQENIENQFWKNKLFKNLTKEAKEVITIVLECPQELLEFAITPYKKLWSTGGVKKYIESRFGKKKTKAILSEIHRFLKEGNKI